MSRLGKFLVVGAVIVWSFSTAARAELCDRGLAVRINEPGLEFVAAKIRPLIPDQYEIPAMDQVVVDWPLTDDDARVLTEPTVAKLTLHDFRLYFGNGNLHVAIRADAEAAAGVQVLNPYASFGSAACQADLQLRDLHVDIGARVTTTGQIRVDVQQATIEFDDRTTRAAIEGCALGTILTKVLDFVRKHFLGQLQARLEELARIKIPVLVERKLSEAIRLAGEIDEFSYAAELQAVDSDPYGVQLLLGAELGLLTTAAPPCLADVDHSLLQPRACSGPAPKLEPQPGTMFGAGVSEAMANSALHTAWRAGMLCTSSEELLQREPALGAALNAVGLSLGLPAETQVGFDLRIARPPFLRLTQAGGAQVEIDDLQLRLRIVPPHAPSNEIDVRMSLTVRAVPTISPRAATVGLDLRDIGVSKLQVLGKDQRSSLPLDPARIERFVQVVAIPALQQKVADQPLSPAVIGFEEHLVDLKGLRVNDGFVAAHVDVYEPGASNDRIAPETLLVAGPSGLVGPQVVTTYVAGQDNETPESLIRFVHRIDGGEWSEPTFSRRIDTAATGGVHRLEVAAVDLQGNRDQTPLLLQFEVDADLPAVQILDRPAPLIDGGEARVSFRGLDSHTPVDRLAFQVQLYRVPDGGGVPAVVETRPFAVNVTSASFTDLDDGVYRIRVTVRDEAGNVSSDDVGFAVERSGCSLAGGSAPAVSSLAWLLLALLILARVRWTR